MSQTLKTYARRARYQLWKLESVLYRGTRFHCPICGGDFDRMKALVGSCSLRGVDTDHYTENAICPRCHSHIRQRFVMEFIRLRTDLLTRRQRLLHFAPEISLYQQLKRADLDYVPADINPNQFVDAVFADITDIPFEAEFDHVICIHVIEHIEDDRKAIAEIFRVLKPGGHALLAVPTYGDTTFEIPGLDYAGRAREYGTGDHLRLNGLDFTDKLKEAGFEVEVVSYDDLPGNFVDRTVVSPHTESDKYIFYCKKPR
jgi:SAM-dependent methyltransferase